MADFYSNTTYTYPTANRRGWLRRAIIAVVILIVVVVAIELLVAYLTIGKVSIRSNDTSAKITLTSITSGRQVAAAKGVLAVTVHTGNYSVDVATEAGETQQVVNIKGHSTTNYTINPSKTVGMEPVSDSTAQNIVAGKSRVLFINNDGKLSKIDSSNNLGVVNANVDFGSIQWASSGYGVGQDQNGNLYVIDTGSATPLSLSLPSNNNPSLYALAPNHQLYISVGKTVYRVSSSGKVQKIYSADFSPTLLLASNNEVVVICNNSSGGKQKSPVAIVGSDGKVVKQNLPGVFVGSISPTQKYIALSTPNGGEVLDTNLSKVSDLTVIKPGITTPVWTSDTTLAYGNGGDLWSYNINTQASQLLSVAPDKGSISELSLSDDSSYVYAGVTHIDGSAVIKRIGLNKQPVPEFLYTLQSAMPYSGNDYFMTLTNFTSPVITVQPFTPLTNTNEQYLQEATSELKQIGVDPSSVSLKLVIP